MYTEYTLSIRFIPLMHLFSSTRPEQESIFIFICDKPKVVEAAVKPTVKIMLYIS